MVAGGLFEEFGAVEDGTAFGGAGGEDDTADSGEADGCGAHGAGFEGDVQVVAGDALGGLLFADFTDHEDFGVSGRVMAGDGFISCAGGYFACGRIDQNGADGDFVTGVRAFCLFHRGGHEGKVCRSERGVFHGIRRA